jgi:predicted alpha/beta-fold hydrolase
MPPAHAFSPEPFLVHPFLANKHVQTILGTLMPRSYPDAAAWRATGEERVFELPDGDHLVGMLHRHPGDPDRRQPLLLLLHGLEGAIDSRYVQGMSVKAHRLGYHSLRLNFRNCGNNEHLAAQMYNSTMIDDIDFVLRALEAEGWPVVVAVGVSMSANMLLGLLARYGDRPPAPVKGAVALSPPIEHEVVSEAFSQGFNKVYDAYFLTKLRTRMTRKAAVSPDWPGAGEMAALSQRVRSLREFDEVITAKALGLENASAYYRLVSAGDRLADVRVPTLIIHAKDDPFIPYSMFERRRAMFEANPALIPIFPEFGGHVGFMAFPYAPRAEAWMDEFWAENQALRFARWIATGD